MWPQVGYFIQVTVARAYVRVIGAQRELSWLVGDTLLPLLSVVGYVLVYRAMKAPPEYTGFVILGGVLMTFWAHMLWSMGLQLFWEKEMGNLARYLMAPLPRPALLLGMALGGIVMTTSRALVIYIASRFLFKIHFNVSQPWLALAVFLMTLASLYGMGMALSSLFFMVGRGANYGLQAIFEPVVFLGGFYFPINRLGLVVASASAALIPTTLGLDALRQTMFNSRQIGFLAPEVELSALVVMSVIFVWLSVFAVRKMEELGRAHGKLIAKEQ
jgi:ABC-2 type transport system permease protein